MVGEVASLLSTPNIPRTKAAGICARYENEHRTEAAKVAYAHGEGGCSTLQFKGRLLTNLSSSD